MFFGAKIVSSPQKNSIMKKSLLITFSILTLNIARAQKVQITWGEESKTELAFNSFVKGKEGDMIKLAFEEHGGGMFSKKTVTPVLVRYTEKLEEAAVRSFEVQDKDIKFNNILSVKNKLYIFTSQYDKESKSTSFFAQQIDIISLNPTGKSISLGTFEAINKSSTTTVGYSVSGDSSKILMFGEAPFLKKKIKNIT